MNKYYYVLNDDNTLKAINKVQVNSKGNLAITGNYTLKAPDKQSIKDFKEGNVALVYNEKDNSWSRDEYNTVYGEDGKEEKITLSKLSNTKYANKPKPNDKYKINARTKNWVLDTEKIVEELKSLKKTRISELTNLIDKQANIDLYNEVTEDYKFLPIDKDTFLKKIKEYKAYVEGIDIDSIMKTKGFNATNINQYIKSFKDWIK